MQIGRQICSSQICHQVEALSEAFFSGSVLGQTPVLPAERDLENDLFLAQKKKVVSAHKVSKKCEACEHVVFQPRKSMFRNN